MRAIIAVVVVVWLAIGVGASAQRHYFSDNRETDCAHFGTVLVTILVGPLNYVGANPKVNCDVPEPSK